MSKAAHILSAVHNVPVITFRLAMSRGVHEKEDYTVESNYQLYSKQN